MVRFHEQARDHGSRDLLARLSWSLSHLRWDVRKEAKMANYRFWRDLATFVATTIRETSACSH